MKKDAFSHCDIPSVSYLHLHLGNHLPKHIKKGFFVSSPFGGWLVGWLEVKEILIQRGYKYPKLFYPKHS